MKFQIDNRSRRNRRYNLQVPGGGACADAALRSCPRLVCEAKAADLCRGICRRGLPEIAPGNVELPALLV